MVGSVLSAFHGVVADSALQAFRGEPAVFFFFFSLKTNSIQKGFQEYINRTHHNSYSRI